MKCLNERPGVKASTRRCRRFYMLGKGARRTRVQATSAPQKSVTERMFEELAQNVGVDPQAGGAGGVTTLEGLRRADGLWQKIRTQPVGPDAGPGPKFVDVQPRLTLSEIEYDVVMCGGTLGIFLATALQLRGLKVAVVERGSLQGRAQEWNISRKELDHLVELGVLSEDELDAAIAMQFNPVRVGFKGSEDIWMRDVLNLGVRPNHVIQAAAARFKASGGTIFEHTSSTGVTVAANGASISTGEDTDPITCKLVLDCMGHASPIVRQLRHGTKPDGVCLVVGSMCSGFDPDRNTTSDVIYTNTDIEPPNKVPGSLQYFWEAFPAGSGPTDRTTYMFTYLDADPRRPSLEAMLEDYWRLMPEYQGVQLDDLAVKRILFGMFPTYRNSPLPPGFDHVLQIGDASGIQSPLSFGGFGAMTRHIRRLCNGVTDAVQAECLDKGALRQLNPYNPGISSAWMLQRAMSVRPEERIPADLINRMLGANFQAMASRGDAVLLPFMQDVMKFGPFAQTVLGQMASDPLFVPQLLRHVGIPAMWDWLTHFLTMGSYSFMYKNVVPLQTSGIEKKDERTQFRLRRRSEAFEYGSGHDYHI